MSIMLLEFLTGDTLFKTLSGNEFSNLLQNFTLAFLTILIPVSLAIFQDGDNKDYNRMVIVNKVLKLDDLLVSVLLCFFPTLLWVFDSTNWFHLFLFSLWIVGCQKIVNIFWINFRWLRGEQEEVKIEFISTLDQKNPDFTTAWELIWRAEDALKYKERDYLTLYSKYLMSLSQNNSWSIIEKLIDGFAIHLNKRTPLYLAFSQELLDTLLQIHKLSWIKSQELRSTKDLISWGLVEEVHRKTEELINKIFIISFNANHSHFFMTKYQKHIELPQTDDSYIESTLSTFFSVLFSDELKKDHSYNFWNHEYPTTWKITKSGINGTHNVVVLQVFNSYLQWLRDKLVGKNKDFKVDSITTDLLPEVDPMVWLPLLDFRLHSFSESRILSMIKRDWNYGHFGRVRVYQEGSTPQAVQQDYQDERNRTYELILYLPDNTFSIPNLESYLSELQAYKPITDQEKRHTAWLTRIFTEMKNYYQSNNSHAKTSSN